MTVRFRASSVHSWLDCPRRASFEDGVSVQATSRPVGLEMGNEVHHHLTGHQYEPAESITYDQHTRTPAEQYKQRARMIRQAEEILKESGITIEENEKHLEIKAEVAKNEILITGTIDLVGTLPDGDKVLLDIKTGATRPRIAWLQLGIYGWLWNHTNPDDRTTSLGVLWLPRSNTQEAKLSLQDADTYILEAEKIIRFRAFLGLGFELPCNPSSLLCSSCSDRSCPFNTSRSDPLN